jgi:hypothetical protein
MLIGVVQAMPESAITVISGDEDREPCEEKAGGGAHGAAWTDLYEKTLTFNAKTDARETRLDHPVGNF